MPVTKDSSASGVHRPPVGMTLERAVREAVLWSGRMNSPYALPWMSAASAVAPASSEQTGRTDLSHDGASSERLIA